MPSDVSHPDNKLPLQWKGRLSEQPPLQRRRKVKSRDLALDDDTSPARVMIEPTKPVNEQGLPAFKIKQEIDPQPFATDGDDVPDTVGLRLGPVLGLGLAVIAILAVAGATLLG